MADREIVCSSCSKSVTVSEFADIAMLKCPGCGKPFQPPQPAASEKPDTPSEQPDDTEPSSAKAPKPKLQVKKREHKTSSLFTPDGTGTAEAGSPNASAPPDGTCVAQVETREIKEKRNVHYLASWAVFLVLGGVMGWLRYGGVFSNKQLATIAPYTVWAILVLYLVTLLLAFSDTVFQGILTLLMPPYFLYYLFLVSDQFYVRAVTAGILVGIGEDAFGIINEHIQQTIDTVQSWIASGG